MKKALISIKFTGIELSDTNFRDLKSFLDDQDQDLNKRYVTKSDIRDYISMAVEEEEHVDDESHILALSALLTMMVVNKIDRVYF